MPKRYFEFPTGFDNLFEHRELDEWYCSSPEEITKFLAIEDKYRDSETVIPESETIKVMKFNTENGKDYSVKNPMLLSVPVRNLKTSGYWVS